MRESTPCLEAIVDDPETDGDGKGCDDGGWLDGGLMQEPVPSREKVLDDIGHLGRTFGGVPRLPSVSSSSGEAPLELYLRRGTSKLGTPARAQLDAENLAQSHAWKERYR